MGKKIESGELAILQAIRARAGRGLRSGVRVGIGDDCAVLTPLPGTETLLTTDLSVEGRHFRRGWHEPEAVGYKCLARGLSDIAAMGGRPVAAFVSLGVPKALAVPQSSRKPQAPRNQSWVERFYNGLLGLAELHGVTLAGGDLSESPTLAFADVVVVGSVARGRALLRSEARAGDVVYVTGTLGGAAAELALLEKHPRRFRGLTAPNALAPMSHPHFFPQPRVVAGHALLGRATTCIDISDGLSTDLMHLCEESGLSAEVDARALPIAKGATLNQALHGGDDYELLFTARPETKVPKRLGGVRVCAIGRMLASGASGPRMTLIGAPGAASMPLLAQGWQHF